MEQRLREQLTRLSDHAASIPRERVPSVALAHRGPRRRARKVIAAMVTVLVTTGAVVFAVLRADETPNRVLVVGSVADVVAPGALRVLPDAPISGRVGPAAVWDGTEMIVWGGSTPNRTVGETAEADGAAYNPRTNAWRVLPRAPIGGRAYASAVWTGTELIVWGGSANGHALGDGAAYNPTTNAWRTIAAAPIGAAMKSATLWTGREMIVVGGLNGGSDAAAYDPAGDRWHKLPDAPGGSIPPYPNAVWTGTQAIFVLDAKVGSRTLETQVAGRVLVTYDPDSRRWTNLATIDTTGTLGWLVWTGQDLLALGGTGNGENRSATFDLQTRSWSRSITSPPVHGVAFNGPVWSGSEAIFWGGGDVGLAYEPATGAWRTYNAGGLRPRVDGAVVWADGVLIGWGGFVSNPDGSASADDQGIVYRPIAAPTTATTAIGTTQGGSTPTSSAAGGDASAETAIRTAFLGWMNAQPHDEISEYVEDSTSIADALRQGIAQHTGADLAKYSGRVESVQMTDATHAAVRYSILFDGSPQYADQAGEAIKIDGAWKVSRETVCNLLTYGGITCPARTSPTPAAGS
jgi:hypothetical protein